MQVLMILYQIPKGKMVTVDKIKEHTNMSKQDITMILHNLGILVHSERIIVNNKFMRGRKSVYELSDFGIKKMNYWEAQGKLN